MKRGLGAVVVTLLVASVLVLTTARPAAAAPPLPTVGLDMDTTPFIGEQVTMELTFSNPLPADTGFGPFTDLFLATNGADGVSGGGPRDGLSFVSASYLGATVPSTVTVLACDGSDVHPLTGQPVSCPPGFTAGDTMTTLTLPFGSFTPTQPAATISVVTQLSNFADAGHPLPVVARGGFRFGADPLDNPLVDPPIVGGSVASTVTPTLITITKRDNAPESETATGPNFSRLWNVEVEIAPGQTVTNLRVSDSLPDSVVYGGVQNIIPTGSVTDQPAGPGPWASESVTVTYPSATNLAAYDVAFWVPELDAGSDPVLDPATGAPATISNDAAAVGNWDPLDPRDAAGTDNAVADPAGPLDTITARSVATQKGVTQSTDTGSTGPTPGDTLTWTVDVQVSDYFDFENLFLEDIAADGQTLDATFSPTISYRTPEGTGSTTLGAFFSSDVNGPGSPGGCASTDPGATTIGVDLAGFLASARPASGGVWHGNATGGTVATITYRTVIDSAYRCRFGGGAVNSRDVIDNVATVSGDVAVPGGARVTDGTREAVTIVAPATSKSVYAINGDTADTGPDIAAGDRVTYRIRATVPLTNVLDLSITDYLPLPTFDIPAGATPFTNLTGSGPVAPGPFTPTAWSVALGPADTFSSATSTTPTLSVDQVGNSVTADYPDYQAAPGTTARTIDLLITVVANDQPFADGLLLTNQARLSSANSPDEIVNQDVIVQVNLTQPTLEITKGVVAASNPAGVFAPAQVGPAGITWSAPGGAGARFSGGPLTSAAIAATPVDSNLSRVDAGDTVTFAVVVNNTGTGIRGAFDVTVADAVPAGFSMPAGGWNLSVTDGLGNPLAHSGTTPSSITLTDPAPDQGALAPYGANVGTNVAVITFDATLDATVAMNATMTNQAGVTNYSGSEGGPSFVTGPIEDTATVTTSPPSFTKTVTATGIGVAPSAPANLELPIGSTAVYRVVATVPEGVTPNFAIRDTLDSGLAFVSFDSITASPGLSTSHAGGFAGALAATAVTGSGTVATIPLDTITNSNTNNAVAETITIDYKVVLLNTTGNTTGGSRNNSVVGRIGSTNAGTAVSAPNIRINEPSLSVAKSASPTSADAGDTITYTVTMTASSATRTSTAHDVVLADTLPSGVDYVAGSFTHTAGVAPSTIDTSTASATWTTLNPGASSTFTLQAVVRDDATSFGPSVTNTARATYTSLPGTHSSSLSPYNTLGVERTGNTADVGGSANTYNRAGTSTVAVNSSTVTKSLVSTSASHTSGASVTIGETATFRLNVTVPDGALGDVTVTDVLPAGLVYVAGSATIDPGTFAGTWTGSPALPAAQMSGNNVNFVFQNMAVSSGPGTADNTFSITLTARVADVVGNTAGTVLANVGRVTVAGTQFNSAPVNLTVVVPALSVVKTFTPDEAAANDSVTVGLDVTNTGSSTAYDTVITDVVDGDVFTAVTPNPVAGWTATAVAQGDDTLVTYTADAGTAIAVAGSQAFSFTATLVADVVAPATHTNTANASTTTLDGVDAGERTVTASGSDTLDVTGVDIAVTKTADVATADAGDRIVYTLTVENLGGRDATGVVVTDTLGSHVSLVSASGSNTVTGNTITWAAFPLAAGASTTRTVTVDVANPLPVGASSTTNAAEATDDGAHGDDTDPSNNTDSVLVGLGSVVDLSVDKTAPATAGPGDSITYGVTVSNLGDRDAADATVTDELGAGLVFVSASGGGTYDSATRTITWNGVDLTGAAGATPSVGYTVVATVAEPLPANRLAVNNTARVDHDDDVNPLNDTDSVNTTIDAEIDLAVTKDDGVSTVVPGDSLTYTVRVTNTGDRGAAGVTTVDTLDANHVFVSASGGGTYNSSTRTVTWNTGVVQVGDTATYSVVVTVANPLVPLMTTQLTNTVTVTDDGNNGPERTMANNTDTDTDTTGVALSVTKALSSDALIPGAEATYTITVTNGGPMTVADLSVNDTMPSDLALVSASVDRGSIDTDTWLWSGANLAPGQTATLTVVVDVSLDATGDQTNTVTVTGVGVGDPDPSDNTASVTDPLDPTADLTISKTLDGELVRGATASWTVVVTNNGPSRATQVTVDDIIPTGLEFTGAAGLNGANWTCTTRSRGVVACLFDGTMEPGDAASLRISTSVSATAPAGPVVNRVEVSGSESETTADNNAAVAAGTLGQLPATIISFGGDAGTGVGDSGAAAPSGAGASPSSLSFTGANALPMIAFGLLLAAAGIVVLRLRRRPA